MPLIGLVKSLGFVKMWSTIDSFIRFLGLEKVVGISGLTQTSITVRLCDHDLSFSGSLSRVLDCLKKEFFVRSLTQQSIYRSEVNIYRTFFRNYERLPASMSVTSGLEIIFFLRDVS